MCVFSYLMQGTINLMELKKLEEDKWEMMSVEVLSGPKLFFGTPNGKNFHKIQACEDAILFEVFLPNYNEG